MNKWISVRPDISEVTNHHAMGELELVSDSIFNNIQERIMVRTRQLMVFVAIPMNGLSDE